MVAVAIFSASPMGKIAETMGGIAGRGAGAQSANGTNCLTSTEAINDME